MQTERTQGIVDYVRPVEGWHAVRVVAALVLFIAAATKCHQYCAGPIPGAGLFSAKWFVICLVEAEWLGTVGLLLLAGVLPKPAWAAALACFGAFTLVSLGKGMMGETSCGCFGRWQVNPFLTATMDAAIVVSLLRWRPMRVAADSGKMFTRALCMLLVWLAVGLPAAYAMGSFATITLSDAGEIASDGKTVALEPEKWTGKRFPLLPYVEVHQGHATSNSSDRLLRERLSEGKWLVLLYHYDCHKCQDVLRCLHRIARGLNVQQVALIEVPPCVEEYGTLRFAGITLLHGRLVNAREWFVESPVALVLDQGMTVGFRSRNELLKNM